MRGRTKREEEKEEGEQWGEEIFFRVTAQYERDAEGEIEENAIEKGLRKEVLRKKGLSESDCTYLIIDGDKFIR